MRDLGGIMAANSPSGIVMREAVKRGDYDTVDLLSCGSGYDVTDEDLAYYLEKHILPIADPEYDEDFSKAVRVLADDGYSDGGEPYTTEEIKTIEEGA